MKTNRQIDRILRAIIGVMLLLAYAQQEVTGLVASLVFIIGIMMLFTAVFGFCGFYKLLGINTCKYKMK